LASDARAALAQPVERRAALLAEACAGDEELRREVESLAIASLNRVKRMGMERERRIDASRASCRRAKRAFVVSEAR
jgi:hypothetical protein